MLKWIRNTFGKADSPLPDDSLPLDLRRKLIAFLSSLPHIEDLKMRESLLYQAGLDKALDAQIDLSGSSAHFVPLLVAQLAKFGQLQDGRNALTSVLDASKTLVGEHKRRHGDELIQEVEHFFASLKAEESGEPVSGPGRIDPYWHLKIDRVNQRDKVLAQTRLMMREQKPKSLVFVWYGQEGDGVEIFHKRLLVELREDVPQAFVKQVCPRWPDHLENYHDAFGSALCDEFHANSLEDIPAKIRAESHGQLTLLYVCHDPVRSTQLINPESLRKYVSWWDAEFAPLLEKKQFALLTVSFLVENPPRFAQYVEEEEIDILELRHTVFWLLDEMEKLAKKDLHIFLRTHNIDIPRDRRHDLLQDILNRTGGRYELTINELKHLRRKAWSVGGSVGKHNEKKKFVY